MQLKQPRLVAIDLDGTLLPASKRLTPRTRDVLAAMEAIGTVVTLATGKFLHLAQRYGEELELTTPVIALDGARIGSNGDGVKEACIPLQTATELLERYDDLSWDAFADDGLDDMLVRASHPELLDVLRPWAERVRPAAGLLGELRAGPAILCFIGTADDMERVAEDAAPRHPELRVSLFESERLGLTRVTFQPRDITKGSGVQTLLEEMGLTPDQGMVFGDWHNDRPMFDVGCFGVAMGNAVSEVKEAAHHVLEETCEQDGVARFLERCFL